MSGTEPRSSAATSSPAWWASWYAPAPMGEFELHSPWWVSGYALDEHEEHVPIVCAAVRAGTETEAMAEVCAAYDNPPAAEDVRWRFCETLDGSPFTDRFPQSEWMAWDGERTCACSACSGSTRGEADT